MSASVPSAKSAEITVPTETSENMWQVKVIDPAGGETVIEIPDNQVRMFLPNPDSDPASTALWLAYAGRWAAV